MDFVINNLDNPNMQNLVRNSPDIQKGIEEIKQKALTQMEVAHPVGDPTLGTIVAVDAGITGDIADGSALGLALSYAEPRAAAGAAFFGLGLIALPLIAGLHDVDEGLEVEKVGVQDAAGFMYDMCKRTREDEDIEKPLTEQQLEERLGPLDPVSLGGEILQTEGDSCNKSRCTEEETARLQQSIANSRASVRRLRRRSALAFMGLTPGASQDEVQQRYKRMALEMHPDKGGDAERFQQLQDMKERLTKSLQEEEDEEQKKKAEEDEESKKLPPSAQAKKLRREAHAEAVKLWDTAREAEAEMFTDKGMLKGSPGPVMARFRRFVEQYSNSKVRMLPHGNKDAAKQALWRFKVDGLELIAVAALVDPSATANLIATYINYKVVARSGSKEIADDAQKLLSAVANVQHRVDNFLATIGRERAEAADAEEAAKKKEEEEGGPLVSGDEVVIVGEEYGEETGKRAFVLGSNQGGVAVRLASGRRLTVPREHLVRAPPGKADGREDVGAASAAASKEPEKPATSEVQEVPKAMPILVKKEPELPPDPERDDWDPDFTHPYVGAMDGAGDAIFCRACVRWIPSRRKDGTGRFAHEPFLRHAAAAHKTPPPGWKGPVPKVEE